MAVPKRKTSPSRRGMRRSADALKAPTYIEDKDSGELRRPHHIDLKTGMYKGRQVLRPKTEAEAGRFDGRDASRVAAWPIPRPELTHGCAQVESPHVPRCLPAPAGSVCALQHGRIPA